MASYPAGNDSLSGQDVDVVSIYGTQDGVATVDEVKAGAALLPPGTEWAAIVGGNHAGFGWYGPQPGDGTASISREEQQAQTVSATVAMLSRLGAGSGQ